ncbi:vitamin K epoxide reductase family protein [Streptosporangium sp. NPDC000396]|uniref:vitamin K epoxide reductase family protein n=1 Tax=Streptosporangium sp. NPDC000396 TaxID=3366185 RepID=UPI003691224A
MLQDVGSRVEQAPIPYRPRWFFVTLALLVITGLAVSVYLTIAHYNHDVALVCAENANVDCAAVTSSEFSTLFGIPLPLLGLAFFVGFGALVTPWAWRSQNPVFRWGRLGSAIGGVLFVVYLVTAELAVLGKICLWCTAVHVITVLLFGLVLFDEYRRIAQVPS